MASVQYSAVVDQGSFTDGIDLTIDQGLFTDTVTSVINYGSFTDALFLILSGTLDLNSVIGQGLGAALVSGVLGFRQNMGRRLGKMVGGVMILTGTFQFLRLVFVGGGVGLSQSMSKSVRKMVHGILSFVSTASGHSGVFVRVGGWVRFGLLDYVDFGFFTDPITVRINHGLFFEPITEYVDRGKFSRSNGALARQKLIVGVVGFVNLQGLAMRRVWMKFVGEIGSYGVMIRVGLTEHVVGNLRLLGVSMMLLTKTVVGVNHLFGTLKQQLEKRIDSVVDIVADVSLILNWMCAIAINACLSLTGETNGTLSEVVAGGIGFIGRFSYRTLVDYVSAIAQRSLEMTSAIVKAVSVRIRMQSMVQSSQQVVRTISLKVHKR